MFSVDEIYGFLSAAAIECERTVIGSIETIRTTDGAVILPVEVNAASMAQAEREAEKVRDAVRLIKETTGEYPLIVTEDRWRSQRKMMQARLMAHLRKFTQIYARNCEVRKIDKETAREFLSACHSYGDAACRYRYGLFLKRYTGHNTDMAGIAPGTLVAVATFSNARKWIKGDNIIRSYEWTRYASLPEVRLSGGMGKLLKAFISDVHPDDIMTYADLEWSEGRVYERLGFVLEGVKEPVTFSIDTESWNRRAVNSGHCPVLQPIMTERYFRNLGSNKYRLKLTDYR